MHSMRYLATTNCIRRRAGVGAQSVTLSQLHVQRHAVVRTAQGARRLGAPTVVFSSSNDVTFFNQLLCFRVYCAFFANASTRASTSDDIAALRACSMGVKAERKPSRASKQLRRSRHGVAPPRQRRSSAQRAALRTHRACVLRPRGRACRRRYAQQRQVDGARDASHPATAHATPLARNRAARTRRRRRTLRAAAGGEARAAV